MSFKNIIEDLREKEYFYKDKKGKWKLHRNPNPNSKVIAEWKLEKTADELFKELGYEKIENIVFENCCLYHKDVQHYGFKEYFNIIFHYNTKIITIEVEYLTIQELQAINKKVEELGWIK